MFEKLDQLFGAFKKEADALWEKFQTDLGALLDECLGNTESIDAEEPHNIVNNLIVMIDDYGEPSEENLAKMRDLVKRFELVDWLKAELNELNDTYEQIPDDALGNEESLELESRIEAYEILLGEDAYDEAGKSE